WLLDRARRPPRGAAPVSGPPMPVRLWYLPTGIEADATATGEGCERLSNITPELVRETVQTLDAAAPAFASLSVRTIVAAIDAVVRAWQEPQTPFRLALLDHGPALTRYSEAALRHAI